jgi:Zn-dependent protease with chaperone function
MHPQTESTWRPAAGGESNSGFAVGLGLYLLTLTGEVVLGAGARWLLIYLGAATLGAIVPLGLSAGVLAWTGAIAPLVHSVLGFAAPGQGWLWRRRVGARRASEEEELALGEALDLLHGCAENLAEPAAIYVLDDPLPSAAIRGRALIVTRGMLEAGALPAVLAHELGHINSLDGRLTDALKRLIVWADPLGPASSERATERPAEVAPGAASGLIWGLARLLARLAGGGVAERLLAPAWSAYWRSREYAADAYAGSLGQAEDLAGFLADFEQPFDAPQPGVLLKDSAHPPVALRIERLQRLSFAGGSK